MVFLFFDREIPIFGRKNMFYNIKSAKKQDNILVVSEIVRIFGTEKMTKRFLFHY